MPTRRRRSTGFVVQRLFKANVNSRREDTPASRTPKHWWDSCFELPTHGAFPSMITCGPDRSLWFTLNQANAIGRIDSVGNLTQIPAA